MRGVWDAGFAGGSFVATFMQGATLGALVYGLPVGAEGRYAGSGVLDWFTPFAALCGIGLVLADAMLGSAWLVLKGEGRLRERAYRSLPWLLGAVLVFAAIVFVGALGMNLQVMQRWVDRPWLAVFPGIGLAAVAAMLIGIRRRRDAWPFAAAAIIFASAFAMLAASFLPYMVPFSITIAEAAAPPSTLSFMFWGAGAFILPLIIAYNIVVYAVFKGKIARA
jgi:cytochrome d ubiquinol oxidase subunit II